MSVKLREAVLAWYKRRSRERLAVVGRLPVPRGNTDTDDATMLLPLEVLLIRETRSHALIRISQPGLRLRSYFGYAVNPDNDRLDANATRYARTMRHNQSTLVLNHDYLEREDKAS